MNPAKPPSRLFLRQTRPPERVLLYRLALLASLVLSILAVFWWDRAGLRDHLDGHVSFGDVLYFTAVTVTTVGYGDIVPVSDRARLLDAIFVTPARLLIWLIFLGTTYELVLQRWLENRRMNRMQRSLQQHLIICGYGHSGQSAAQEATARGVAPEQILVMDRDEGRLLLAAAEGFVGLRSDPTRERDLLDAGIARAKAVLVCLGRDDAAVLAVLTIRQLNPGVRIVCSVAEAENIKLIRQAGASAIVAPSMVGGYLMADSVQSSHVADYIYDLMQSAGRVRLIERAAQADEIGRAMRDLRRGMVVRLIRQGQAVGFWEGERARIQAGDVLIAIEVNGGTAPESDPPAMA